MRILYHHRTLGDGAEGIHIAEMIRAFRQLGHEVELAGPSLTEHTETNGHASQNRPSSALAFLKKCLPEVGVRAAEVLYNVKSYRTVSRAIQRFEPDFIYERYSCFGCGGIRAAKRRGVPVILEVNATFAGKWGARHKLYFNRLARRIETYALRNATAIATVSTPLKESLVETGIPEERVLVTPNAIDPDRIRAVCERSPGQAIRQRYNLGDGPVIGFVGSFRRWHGIDLLIKCAPAVLKKFPSCRFFIVGFGELEREIRQLAEDQGSPHAIVLPGRVAHDEVLDYIDAMDVAVMPNSNEFGSPMKVFEYMGMGKTVVAPQLGPLEDVIEDNVTGALVASGDQYALEAKLLELLADSEKRRALGRNGKAVVLGRHTWQQNAEDVLDLLDRCASPRELSFAR